MDVTQQITFSYGQILRKNMKHRVYLYDGTGGNLDDKLHHKLRHILVDQFIDRLDRLDRHSWYDIIKASLVRPLRSQFFVTFEKLFTRNRMS
jgi:hypothetical protein